MNDGWLYLWIITILFTALVAVVCYENYKTDKENERKINELANSSIVISPKEFFILRANTPKSRQFGGVYILHNITKDMYYVGQGQCVFDRVNCHFVGRGNGDVYADYKYGDIFSIRMIAFENSGFHSLNELERYAISKYDAYYHGYNKTRGNH